MKNKIIAAVAAVLITVIAGCGGGSSASTTAKVTCAVSFSTWYYHHGGKAEIYQLDVNFRPMVTNATAVSGKHNFTQAVKAANLVQHADTQLQGNMPPACIPNLHADLLSALVAVNKDAAAVKAKNVTGVQTYTVTATKSLKASAHDLLAYVKN